MAVGPYALVSVLLMGAGPYDGIGTCYDVSSGTSYHGATAAGEAGVVVGEVGVTWETAYATGEICGEPMYPYDAQLPWMHGYFREVSPYSGSRGHRPYNYRQLLSKVQVSGDWGMSPQRPYSQQFWQKYQDRAAMRKLSTSLDNPSQGPPAPRAAAETAQPATSGGPSLMPREPADPVASNVNRATYERASRVPPPGGRAIAPPEAERAVEGSRHAPWDLEHRGDAP